MTTQPPPVDPDEQAARQARLEALYLADGRDNPKHKMYNLYTGLCVDQPTSEEQPNE